MMKTRRETKMYDTFLFRYVKMHALKDEEGDGEGSEGEDEGEIEVEDGNKIEEKAS